jgi:hypothetical protein
VPLCASVLEVREEDINHRDTEKYFKEEDFVGKAMVHRHLIACRMFEKSSLQTLPLVPLNRCH